LHRSFRSGKKGIDLPSIEPDAYLLVIANLLRVPIQKTHYSFDSHVALPPSPFCCLAVVSRRVASTRACSRTVPDRLVRWREKGVQVGTDTAYLPPEVADHGQQLRARLANFLRRTVGVMQLVEELLHSLIFGHDAAPTGEQAF
jgi:hypothetical protein